jgi:hypothetical protein
VAALERRGPERLEAAEEGGSTSAVVDPPVLAPDMDSSSVEKVSPDPRSPPLDSLPEW